MKSKQSLEQCHSEVCKEKLLSHFTMHCDCLPCTVDLTISELQPTIISSDSDRQEFTKSIATATVIENLGSEYVALAKGRGFVLYYVVLHFAALSISRSYIFQLCSLDCLFPGAAMERS